MPGHHGGLYAAATDIDHKTDADAGEILDIHGVERDMARPELGNIITPPLAREIMGYEQMDYYTPIKV